MTISAIKSPNPAPAEVFNIDLTPFKAYLFDLAGGAKIGMRSVQPGFEFVVLEVVGNQPTLGGAAGITVTAVKRFQELNDQYVQLKSLHPRLQKAVEVLLETRSWLDHQRHRLITQFANSAEEFARMEGNDPTLTTAYEKTISYRSIVADRAVKTRQKNEEAKNNPPAGAPDPTPPAATPPAQTPDDQPGEPVVRVANPAPDVIFTINLALLQSFLVDLPPGARRGMRTEQDGYESVLQEIMDRQAMYGDRAGITITDYNRFVLLNEQYDMVVKELPKVQKAEEVVGESLAYVDNLRHQLVTRFANSAEEHAQAAGGDPTLLTAYERTISYRSVIADKAVRTRQKNEDAGPTGPTGPTGGASGGTGPNGPTAGGGTGASGTAGPSGPANG
jgi:uncharacterized membrane-anchored protein YhcB (DUF1043 family)